MPVTMPGRGAVALLLALLTGACSVAPTHTGRSAIEQELIVRSIERAIASLDTSKLLGRKVALEIFGLNDDREFARQMLLARLRVRGVEVVETAAAADYRVRAFATVLGVNQGDTLVGVPALQVPVVSIPVPSSRCSRCSAAAATPSCRCSSSTGPARTSSSASRTGWGTPATIATPSCWSSASFAATSASAHPANRTSGVGDRSSPVTLDHKVLDTIVAWRR